MIESSDPPESRPASLLISETWECQAVRTMLFSASGMLLGAILQADLLPWAAFSAISQGIEAVLTAPLVDLGALSAWGLSLYQSFNQLEGLCWFVLAGLVYRRWNRFRSSPLEPLYAFAFVLFGLTDFLEAQAYPVWLLLSKGLILLILLYCRSVVLRCHYPQARIY